MSRKLIVGLTGASGAAYGLRLLWHLSHISGATDLIFSQNYFKVLAAEAGDTQEINSVAGLQALLSEKYGPAGTAHNFEIFQSADIAARAASGSAQYRAMVVVPCSMKTLASIAQGLSQNLIERAADVSLKERRPLILCPRETPLSPIHLRNMLSLTESGATIMPLMPGYYHSPQSLTDLYDFMADRILAHCGFSERIIKPWKS